MNWILKTFMYSVIVGITSCNMTPTKAIMPIQVKNDLSQVKWWNVIQDPNLNTLISQALASNNQLMIARANIMQAQAQLKVAYNAWLPTLNASTNVFGFSGTNTHLTPQGALAQTSILTQANNFKVKGIYAGFVPSYSLNLLENISNQKLAKASLAEQRAVYNAIRLSIISQTAGSYFALLGYKQQLAEQKQLIKHLNNLRHLEQVRYKSGASDYSALAVLDQRIAEQQAYAASIETSIAQVHNALQLLINHAPGTVITHKTLNSVSTKNIIPANLPAQILQSRPDIMIAREQLNRADATLGLSYSQFFPQFSLTGLLGGSSIELIHLLKLSTGLGVAELSAMMPLFNGVIYHQIQASKSGVKAAYYNYVQIVLAALIDVDNNLTQYKKTNEIYQNQLKAYKASLRGYRIQESRYKHGYQDSRSAINAAITADTARINLTLAKIAQLNNIVSVYQALGGGYRVKQ